MLRHTLSKQPYRRKCVCVHLNLRYGDFGSYRTAQSVWRRAGRPGFDSWQGQEIFIFSTTARPALGSTQPPLQCLPGALSPEVKRPGHEAAEVKKKVEL
jgi:hypothetical protein